jgi:hypothetical protein
MLQIQDFYPDHDFLSLPDPRSNNINKRGRGACFVVTNITKVKVILFLNRYRKTLTYFHPHLRVFQAPTLVICHRLAVMSPSGRCS